jgi:hypothetical protein
MENTIRQNLKQYTQGMICEPYNALMSFTMQSGDITLISPARVRLVSALEFDMLNSWLKSFER